MTRVAVVGAGAVGLSLARELAARGATVDCYDRGAPGDGATGRAAGLCYDAFADPLDADLAARSLERYREHGLLVERPYVWLARSPAGADAISDHVERMRANGRDVELLDPAGLAERYPALVPGGSDGARGEEANGSRRSPGRREGGRDPVTAAGIARDAGFVDPRRPIDRLVELARGAGASVHGDTPVDLVGPGEIVFPSTEPSGGSGHAPTSDPDAVVVAAGAATPEVLDGVAAVPLAAYRTQVAVTEPVDAALPTGYDAARRFYWRPSGEGVLVGDRAEPTDPREWDRRADPEFRADARDHLAATVGVAPAVVDSWAGLCTTTPDRDPLVGRVAPRTFVAAGWHGHGVMRAPGVAERLAGAVLAAARNGGGNSKGAAAIPAYDPGRFDGDETVPPPE